MSFSNTKTPLKPTTPAKWPVPRLGAPPRYCLEGETKAQFCRLFPIHTNRRIMQWFGISFTTLHRFSRELGLKKDMKAIHREHARDIKKTCERNGYYASIRGKAPSEACREAARKKRAEGFHPLLHIKANNPRKYQRLMKRQSIRIKELWRKEELRELYGLERKTKLHITLNRISHKASGQKHLMIKRHNYFADPSHPSFVCYDSLTTRSPRMEATAIRHGLRVVAGEDEDITTNKTE